MDPVGFTRGVDAVITAVLRSVQATKDVVDGLQNAPQTVAECGSLLHQTEITLIALQQTLEAYSEPHSAIASFIHEIEISKALYWTTSVCQQLEAAITSPSTGSGVKQRSKSLHSNKLRIQWFERDLAHCQRTITNVLSAITLIASSRTSGNVEQLQDQFDALDWELVDLGKQLGAALEYNRRLSVREGTSAELRLSAQLTGGLQEICQRAVSTTRAYRTGRALTPDPEQDLVSPLRLAGRHHETGIHADKTGVEEDDSEDEEDDSEDEEDDSEDEDAVEVHGYPDVSAIMAFIKDGIPMQRLQTNLRKLVLDIVWKHDVLQSPRSMPRSFPDLVDDIWCRLRLNLPEPRVPSGKRRIRWTCVSEICLILRVRQQTVTDILSVMWI
ncbi:hypothetical protein CONLIGDRAFT_575911 [Coniochaeta ligniaria NRRL 30616]|uniref:Fungal N-terminal domain-containing protein n=1 Tax=Coniochaeta ligniaria NRRL 30616 TaxID=1408157 RepID=A0A1J7ISI2_9PEZI|nr:hypothetical protein CONLIGDRAFT_575911 [Coniochaeta ligniaria NRRL 30616]